MGFLVNRFVRSIDGIWKILFWRRYCCFLSAYWSFRFRYNVGSSNGGFCSSRWLRCVCCYWFSRFIRSIKLSLRWRWLTWGMWRCLVWLLIAWVRWFCLWWCFSVCWLRFILRVIWRIKIANIRITVRIVITYFYWCLSARWRDWYFFRRCSVSCCFLKL